MAEQQQIMFRAYFKRDEQNSHQKQKKKKNEFQGRLKTNKTPKG